MSTNSTGWNPNLNLLPTENVLIYLCIAAMIGSKIDFMFYVWWIVEILFWVLFPVAYLTFFGCCCWIAGTLYYMVRWVIIFNGFIIGSIPWLIINVPTFIGLDIHTLPWVVESMMLFINRTSEGWTEHKDYVYYMWRRLGRGEPCHRN